MKRTHAPPANLLELRPARKLEWRDGEENLVTLVIPKFRSRFAARWFVPLLAKPTILVKLDERGSFFWRSCDGVTPVAQIGERMSERFGDPLDATYERIGKFVQQLARDRFITLDAQQTLTQDHS
jgi:hypothetical protein